MLEATVVMKDHSFIVQVRKKLTLHYSSYKFHVGHLYLGYQCTVSKTGLRPTLLIFGGVPDRYSLQIHLTDRAAGLALDWEPG